MSHSQSSTIPNSPTLKDQTELLTEDEIITKRVTYCDDLMDSCVDSFYMFYDALNYNKKDKKHIDILENDLLQKLLWWQLKSQLGKQCEMTLNNDINIYKQQLKSLTIERQNIINDIEKLKKKLNNAKIQRDNQEEYNIMIQQINKEPQRQQTTKLLNEMEIKLKQINNSLNECNKTIEMRSKQCYAAFASVQALNRSITETPKNNNNNNNNNNNVQNNDVDNDNDVDDDNDVDNDVDNDNDVDDDNDVDNDVDNDN
eukprot:35799_1